MTINPAVSTENNTAWVSFASAMAVKPAEVLARHQLLILSDITSNPFETIEAYQPMADYLAA